MSDFSTTKSIIRVGNLQIDTIPTIEDKTQVPLPEQGDTIMECIQKLTNAVQYVLAIIEQDGQTVVNGIGTVDDKVTGITSQFNAAKGDIDSLKTNVLLDKTQIDSIRTAIGDLTTRVAALEA